MVNKVTLQIHEVLDKTGKTVKKADKVQFLKQNDSFALRSVLQATYHPNIKLDLPEGDPPYTANAPHSAPSDLSRQARRFSYFAPPKSTQMNPVKRESMFIQLLEAIHPEDAKVVLQMKDKKPFKGISSAVVKEAFPNILP